MDSRPNTASPNVKPYSKEQLTDDFRQLGVRTGDLLNVKASLRSIGPIDGGAQTLIEALLEAVGPEGTIVTDSFITAYPLPLRGKAARVISGRDTPSYAGALANAMLKHPNTHCSSHPIQRFAAIGKQAKELTHNHVPGSYAYDVLRVLAENDGRNLKIGPDNLVVGVGTTHVAIGQLGLRQKRVPRGINYIDAAGQQQLYPIDWAGGCGIGFNNFLPLYREKGAILHEGEIGQAPSKITDMAMTLKIEKDTLKDQPAYFHCGHANCIDCRLSWEFSPDRPFSLIREYLTNGKIKSVVNVLRLEAKGSYLPLVEA